MYGDAAKKTQFKLNFLEHYRGHGALDIRNPFSEFSG